ncbi:hypothetical protein HOY82DRAFT_549916 [Tuber indicum]|nr:hypothetical protein HOY82DRAFT_549916 [Tuber indicum]
MVVMILLVVLPKLMGLFIILGPAVARSCNITRVLPLQPRTLGSVGEPPARPPIRPRGLWAKHLDRGDSRISNYWSSNSGVQYLPLGL